MERTLTILKPDSVKRAVVGEIITRFERAGLKIVAIKMVQPSAEHFYKHYEEIGKMISRRGKQTFDVTLKFMMEGPVIAVVLEGVEAAALVRKMVGSTEPKEALPGTIRGDYAHMSFSHADKHKQTVPNIIHASGDAKEAKEEIAHWFSDSEIHSDYKTTHEHYTVGSQD